MYQNEFHGDQKKTWLHFKMEGYKHKTINRYIKKFGESGQVVFKKTPGQTPKIMTSKKVAAVKKLFHRNPSTTTTLAAKKLKLTLSTLKRIKVDKLGIRARSKKKCSKA